MTVAVDVPEAAAVTVETVRHERTIGSKGNGLWGMKGAQLPAYMQHVYNDLVEGGEPTGSPTYRKAVGIVENWAAGHDGKGNKVSSDTQAKASAAVAEWNKLRAKAKVSEAVKGAVMPPTTTYLTEALAADEVGDLKVLEASGGDAEDKKDGGADEATESAYCVSCKAKRKPTKDKNCPECGTDLSKSMSAAKKVQEAVVTALARG